MRGRHFIYCTLFDFSLDVFLFKENSNSTESSFINNDDIWKTRMREVRFLVLKLFLTFLQIACMVITILTFLFHLSKDFCYLHDIN